jgi:hypothetical protein
MRTTAYNITAALDVNQRQRPSLDLAPLSERRTVE